MRGKKIMITIILTLVPLASLIYGVIPAQEREALIALYNSTNGDNWTNNSGWKEPPLDTDGFAMPGTEGAWYGITVSGDRVIWIRMENNGLQGSLPSDLKVLTKLKELEFYSNQINGKIPKELGYLISLEYLRISNNLVNGEIPAELGNLRNLKDLHIDYADLTGSIPLELTNLNNLKTIRLASNHLSGNIPKELANMKNLEALVLDSNDFTGEIPPELGNLANLNWLGLSDNELTGSIPKELGNLKNMGYLYLNSNYLSGSIPEELGNLKNSRHFWLYDNNLSGSIPPELGNLSKLEDLRIDNNNLSGNIPQELGNLSNLQYLILYNNPFSGNIPKEIGNLSKLEYLYLSGTQLEGSIPKQLGNLSNLKGFFLGWNRLSGNIPPELENLSKLENLQLDHNQLSGSIPSEIGNLSNLKYLYLDQNQLSGSISSTLGNLSNLEGLYLYENQLSGSIPSELGNLSKLVEIQLYKNKLSGSIPPELGGLSNLDILWLSNNQLSGNIPSELGNLKKLSWLSLDYNQLSGSIPSELGDLSNLEGLYLSHNNLSGEIPSSLTNLSKILPINFSISYNCLHTSDSALKAWLDSIDPGWENHQSECISIPSEIYVNRDQLNYGYIIGSQTRLVETFTISNRGGGTLNWSVSCQINNVSISPTSGIDGGVVEVAINPEGLSAGKFKGELFVSDPTASNSPVTVRIHLWVKKQSESSPPFGEFATPVDSSTVRSSVAVTGWALGDTGMESVKIYREEGRNLVYIGDAVFVEGARPDVEAAYPDYPMNYKAGWGYMMLTNFLPNGGNGTFQIRAIATDKEGLQTTLGIKAITCDNANAVKPFGAIDTPGQGGTASGGSYINWGWALTPQPNSIPTDGSTINVWVDGINLGNPTYNIYRKDIADLFPGYANSNGSAGYFYLDTTAYENGVHTIQWTVTDNAGNNDGIGSRYFTIENSGTSAQQSLVNGKKSLADEDLSPIRIDYSEPVRVRKGYNEDMDLQEIYPDDSGVLNIEIKELERLEVQFSRDLSIVYSYMVAGNQFKTLPFGSFIESKTHTFNWMPGPGFIGEYKFIFILKGQNGEINRKNINVKIFPKFMKDQKKN